MSTTENKTKTSPKRGTRLEQTTEKEQVEVKKMEVEINRYKQLLEALDDPKKVAKMVAMIVVIFVLIFMGITSVMLIVKNYYPYNSINSNKYGATIIKNEDMELIYWLFNSADLWANSGIEVKKGDVISVKTSGAFHTAIHHLTKDANDNTTLRDNWIFSSGGSQSINSELKERDEARSKFRIVPNVEENILLMQVVPDDIAQTDNWQKGKNNNMLCYIDGMDVVGKKGKKEEILKADIYVLGERNNEVRIRTDGVLHFAVNDIALTDRVIESMKKTSGLEKDKLKLGKSKSGEKKVDELEYYLKESFVDAWYADNVGSFLVVIERKNKKL